MSGVVEEAEWTKAIWTPGSIPRQSFHAWLVALNRIPTRDRLLNWGLQVPSLCLLCNSVDETRDHLFWDCGYSYALWSQVASRCRITPIRRWEDSIEQMTTFSSPTTARSLTLLGWQATLYWIWNERNQRLHANQFRSVDSLFTIVDHQIRNKIQSFRGTNPTQSSEMMQLWIRWSGSVVIVTYEPLLIINSPSALSLLDTLWTDWALQLGHLKLRIFWVLIYELMGYALTLRLGPL